VCACYALPIKELKESSFFANPEAYTFGTYVKEFGKIYKSEEMLLREVIFNQNMKKIHDVNAKFRAGIYTWTASVNKFTDLTSSEMKRFKGLKKDRRQKNAVPFAEANPGLLTASKLQALPPAVDWRSKGVVSPVKDQGGCGSCWAFSSTEAIESAVALATGKLPILAPQQFVDCVKNPNQCGGTGGCEGATQPIAFNYTVPVGLASESAYPYTGMDGTCNTQAKPTAGIKGYVQLALNDWTQLMTAVANVGPVSISAAAEAWQLYFGGVFNAGAMCGYDIDHAVMVDGYGVDSASGLGYWLVRNSWGGLWGEGGYIRIFRELNATSVTCGTDNTPGDGFGCQGGPPSIQVCGECGILSDSSYPTGAFLY